MSFPQKIKSLRPAGFLGLMTVAGALFTLIFLAVTGNQPQVYTDIIVEWTSQVLSNKSAEMFLIYFLSLAGLLVYMGYYMYGPYNAKFTDSPGKTISVERFIVGIVSCIMIYSILVVGKLKFDIFSFFLLVCIASWRDKEHLIDDMIFFFLSIFTVYALYMLYAWFGGTHTINKHSPAIVALISICVICLRPSYKSVLFQKSVLIMQIILPALLLVYVADRYLLNGEIVTVKPLLRIRLFVYGVMAGLIISGIANLKKYWHTPATLNQILSFGVYVAIAGFLVSSSKGLQIPVDLHHPFENIIGFHQLFQMGQKAFVHYIPVSGMYSVVQGAFFEWMGAGLLSHYYITETLFLWIISVLVLGLLKLYLKNTSLFLIALVFIGGSSVYINRSLFILPIMLLLSWPKLIENRNLWLKVWLLTSLFHGLYYPVYGAAVCLAFAPLGIYQIITFITSGQLRKESQKNGFLLKWCICFLPVLLAVPWLQGTFHHIRAMAAQTVLADGISRFGQQFSFPIVLFAPLGIRLSVGYLFTFLFPAVLVWGGFAFALYVFHLNKYEKINRVQVRDGCIVLSLVILPLVAFSYTMVRLDTNSLFARNIGIFSAMAVMFVVYVLQYGRTIKIKQILIGLALCVPFFSYSWGILTETKKLQPYITLSEDTVQLEPLQLNKAGQGFVKKTTGDFLKQESLQPKLPFPYFGLSVFGLYYAQDIKGSSVLEPMTIKGFDAAQETTALLNHYLITGKNYVYDPARNVFRPNDGSVSTEQILQRHRLLPYGKDLFVNKTFAAWGQSIKSLRPIFSTPQVSFETKVLSNSLQIHFSKPLYGDDADFMYIEFDGQDQSFEYALYDMAGWHKLPTNLGFAKYFVKKNYNPQRRVEISWTDESGENHKLFSGMDKGKLLIPLGAVAHWLLNDHSSLQIRVTDNALPADLPPVKKIEFLKLREVH
ncbi:hypothetical protein [Candidatus Avelusimicrobium luingense]|uniref:hypothetical protein n=1 Tax=Candidatus Avelusimicrobium luingense TaxID=3416211 RepID=UPI003D13F5E0